MENYLSDELKNVTLRVLEGEIILEEEEEEEAEVEEEKGCGQGTMVKEGDAANLKTGRFHKVHTVGSHPVRYVYTFANGTKQHLALHPRHRQYNI